MLIDWFTVGALVLNFLLLVWLMKRFLYRPILQAIDAREQRIATELADAAAKQADAQQAREEFRYKNTAFEQRRAALLRQAVDEAKVERLRLLDEARQAADSLSAKQQETLHREQQQLHDELTRRTREEAFAIVRKALTDLAGASLEERVRSGRGQQRLRAVGGATRHHAGCAQGDLLGRYPRPLRDRAAADQRDRTAGQRTQGGLEHRGIS